MKTGIRAFLDILAAAGVSHLFGNPGTTELPLTDALAADASLRYVLGLHEIPVVSMADGYALASRRLGVVNLHIACGLGNAMGMIYNAHIAGTPLLITAGQQDRRLLFGEPVLSGDLVGMVRPVTKYAAEVQRVQDLPHATRRAIQAALTPPTGPVFLSMPLDVQLEVADGLDVRPPTLPDFRVPPTDEALDQAVELLLAAKNPVILAGSRVADGDACQELKALAEAILCPVYSECATSHGRLPMPPSSPLYAGPLPLWSPDVRKLLDPHDVIFVIGMNLLRSYIWVEPEEPIPPQATIIHADSRSSEIGKNYPVAVALPGDLAIGLRQLTHRLQVHRPQQTRNEGAWERHRQAQSQRQQELLNRVQQEREQRPMSPAVLMDVIRREFPENAAYVDEATTTGQHFLERMGLPHDPLAHFAHRGWALGWGIGCALGVKLAWPDRPVLALIGDGAAMYGIQALWSAAHHHIPITCVIANNAQYKILKDCSALLPLPQMASGNHLGMNLTPPDIDFVGLARSLGVEAHRVADPDELSQRLRDSWDRRDPILFDVPLQR